MTPQKEESLIEVHSTCLHSGKYNYARGDCIERIRREAFEAGKKAEREELLDWNKKRHNSYMRRFALVKNDYMDGWEDGWNKAVKDTTHYLQALTEDKQS